MRDTPKFLSWVVGYMKALCADIPSQEEAMQDAITHTRTIRRDNSDLAITARFTRDGKVKP